jgi:hypothetical protein
MQLNFSKELTDFLSDKSKRIERLSLSRTSNNGIVELKSALLEIRSRVMSDSGLSDEEFEDALFGSNINHLVRDINQAEKKNNFTSRQGEFNDTKHRLISLISKSIDSH